MDIALLDYASTEKLRQEQNMAQTVATNMANAKQAISEQRKQMAKDEVTQIRQELQNLRLFPTDTVEATAKQIMRLAKNLAHASDAFGEKDDTIKQPNFTVDVKIMHTDLSNLIKKAKQAFAKKKNYTNQDIKIAEIALSNTQNYLDQSFKIKMQI